MGYLTLLRDTDVNDYSSFARFCQQELGTPIPTASKRIALAVNVREFWQANPSLWGNWRVLTETVCWMKLRRKRPRYCWSVISFIPDARAAGCVPAMTPRAFVDDDLEERLYAAVQVETDDAWKTRLLGACGVQNQREVLSEWRLHR